MGSLQSDQDFVADDSLDSKPNAGYSIEPMISSSKDKRAEKKRISRNVFILCLAFLLNFTAFGGIANLQSSLNADDGLGTASLSVIYAALILSAMFSPTFIIKHLGCTRTIAFSIMGYVTYYAGNFYPSWYTLIPTSIVLGFCGAPLWIAKCTYLSTSAKKYSAISKESADAVLNRYFGMFFFVFQIHQVAGNLISSFILSQANSTSLVLPTEYDEQFINEYCGSEDCPAPVSSKSVEIVNSSSETELPSVTGEKMPKGIIYMLMAIYTSLGIASSLLVLCGVDKITHRAEESRSPKQLLLATFKHMKDKRQLMLIVLTMFSGLEQAFLTGDFTRSYITCPLAVNWVGVVMICYGIFDAVFSYVFGRIEKYTGRIPLFTFAAVLHAALIIIFKFWKPYPSSAVFIFLFPALWGICDGIWQTQINSFYGVIFSDKQEESFANYRLWESMGFLMAFAYQNFLCINVKLYILLGFLIPGILLYYMVEYTQRRYKQEHPNTIYSPAGKTEKL